MAYSDLNPDLASFSNNVINNTNEIRIGNNRLGNFVNNSLSKTTTLTIIAGGDGTPMTFSRNILPDLRVLNLSGQNITEFKNNILYSLEELYVDSGSVEDVDFVGSKLVYLDMHNNKIKNFSGKTMPNLIRMDLSNNLITNFDNN